MSACHALNPRRTFRPKLPCCPLGAAEKAALFRILPPGYCDPCSSKGIPEMMLGRGARAVPATKKVAPTTLTGGADLAKMKLSTDQSRATWSTTFCHREAGRL